MHFVDECTLRVEAGNGGDGAIAFRREKYVPLGGPAGGDGGRGGSIVLGADSGLGTLSDLKHKRIIRAKRGENGGGKDCYGAGGPDVLLLVPLGTQVFDPNSNAMIIEITEAGQRFVVAEGGEGGRGNKHFATPEDRGPRKAEKGGPGDCLDLRLELKVMADVGLLGFPNVGKSTFIRAVSQAKPKVANYPFTTLKPHLGVVNVGETHNGLGHEFVIADIPGLIAGASDGAGLGIQFLKHVERTRVLLHLITVDDAPARHPMEDYRALREELRKFQTSLSDRPEIVALSKADLPDNRELYEEFRAEFAELGIELLLFSSATHQGLTEIVNALSKQVLAAKARSSE